MKNKTFFEKVKTGRNEFHQIINHPECIICNAQDKDGFLLRKKIDKYAITHSYQEVIKYLALYGIHTTLLRVKRHYEDHSSYIADVKEHIKSLAENSAMDKLDSLTERLDPDEVISEIITVGGQKIKTGEMKVTERLLLGALREQGTRRKFSSLRDMLDSLDKVRFGELPPLEGEVLESSNEGQTTENLQG